MVWFWGYEFRERNDSPGSRNLEFLNCCARQMPKGKKIKLFRSDNSAYQATVINHCNGNGTGYAIGGNLDKAVKRVNTMLVDEKRHPYQNVTSWLKCMNYFHKNARS